jgi:hypothetical protein
MCSPLNQLDFVRSRFATACDVFLGGLGMDLLRLKKDGGGTEQDISRQFARHFEEVLRNDGALNDDVIVDSEYY